MASVSVFCILCAASLRKTGNQSHLFSASSRPFVPLLTTYASLICGQDGGLTTTTMDWVLSIIISSAIESQRAVLQPNFLGALNMEEKTLNRVIQPDELLVLRREHTLSINLSPREIGDESPVCDATVHVLRKWPKRLNVSSFFG